MESAMDVRKKYYRSNNNQSGFVSNMIFMVSVFRKSEYYQTCFEKSKFSLEFKLSLLFKRIVHYLTMFILKEQAVNRPRNGVIRQKFSIRHDYKTN